MPDFPSPNRLFRRATPAEMAARELADAELALLQAQSAQEYAASIVAYNESRIKRLRAILNTLSPNQPRNP